MQVVGETPAPVPRRARCTAPRGRAGRGFGGFGGGLGISAASAPWLATFGEPGLLYGQTEFCSGITVDSAGDILVTSSDGRILKFGTPTTPADRTTWGRIKGSYR